MMKIKEIWKDCKGYEGLYQVSNLGRVWSIRSQKYLNGSIDKDGYIQVYLTAKNGKCKKESIDNSYGYDNTDFNDKLEECYFVLKAFDKLCDVLRADLINILNTAEIEEETILEERTYKRIV